jgi:hypothetical protein
MAARVEELKNANALLLDRLLTSHGAQPLRVKPLTAAEMVDTSKPSAQPPMKSRRTPSDIAALCTADMAKRARAVQVSGQIAPPPEMREANNV